LPQVILSTVITFIVSWSVYGAVGLWLMLFAALTAFLVALYIMHLIPGLTGDSYGAVTTIIEVLVLLFFAIR
jgi:cobalamin synthase